jgi:beta-glucosidase
LSYSKFEYGNLKLSTDELQAPEMHDEAALTIEVDVKNVSQKAGDEVVELYIDFPKMPGAPLRALRGFTRVHIGAGEQQHVKLTLRPRDLSYVNESGDRYLSAGDYLITVGGGQPGASASTSASTSASHAEAHLTIRGEQKLPE